MNQEELKPIIDAIVREVMKKLQDSLEEPAQVQPKTRNKEKLFLVFTGGTGNLDTVLARLKSLGHKYNYYACFTPAAEKAFGRERVKQEIEFAEVSEEDFYHALTKVDTIVFPTLTQNTAAKATLGIRDTLACETLACGLLLKKRVIAVIDSIPLSSMPATYARMVGDMLRQLEQLGVDLCKADELVNKIITTSIVLEQEADVSAEPLELKELAEQPLFPKAYVLESKLVTAEVIYQAAREGHTRILLPPKALVTPMARDTAKDKHIALEWVVN